MNYTMPSVHFRLLIHTSLFFKNKDKAENYYNGALEHRKDC